MEQEPGEQDAGTITLRDLIDESILPLPGEARQGDGQAPAARPHLRLVPDEPESGVLW